MIVLDASAVVELVLGLEHADEVRDRIVDPELTLHAPGLLVVEVAQVVRRFSRLGHVSASRGTQALTALVDLGVETYPHEPLLPRIWQLRDTLTSYDAAYVALTEALDARLLTTDARLARAPGLRCPVDLVGESRSI